MKKWLKCEIKKNRIIFPKGLNMTDGDKIKFQQEWDDAPIVISFLDGKKFIKTGELTIKEAYVFMEVAE